MSTMKNLMDQLADAVPDDADLKDLTYEQLLPVVDGFSTMLAKMYGPMREFMGDLPNLDSQSIYAAVAHPVIKTLVEDGGDTVAALFAALLIATMVADAEKKIAAARIVETSPPDAEPGGRVTR